MNIPNKQGRAPIYESSLKIAVAREYLTSNLGYGKLAQKYGLNGPSVVREFVKWYNKRYPPGHEPQPQQTIESKGISDKQGDKALQEANLKIEALETLIEIAQKELGIDIVKKFGTKRSMK
jgi:transposase-like protein